MLNRFMRNTEPPFCHANRERATTAAKKWIFTAEFGCERTTVQYTQMKDKYSVLMQEARTSGRFLRPVRNCHDYLKWIRTDSICFGRILMISSIYNSNLHKLCIHCKWKTFQMTKNPRFIFFFVLILVLWWK